MVSFDTLKQPSNHGSMGTVLPQQTSRHELQKQTLETNKATPTFHPSASVASHFSPWLTPLAYPLMSWFVLPNYFKKIEVFGQENLLTQGPVILAPTHRSRWDALMVGYAAGRWATGRDLRFMVTVDEVRGIQGWFIRQLGGFPVNTKQPAIASLRHGVEVLQDQQALVIFPEGAIFRDNEVHPLKPGLARLALQAETMTQGLGVNIIPIHLHYSQPLPHWRDCEVTIRIGTPIPVANYKQGAAKQNAQLLTAELEARLKQLGTNDSDT
jgi:1-acyl-sn-glycerol-3-phosphate acyltransferase